MLVDDGILKITLSIVSFLWACPYVNCWDSLSPSGHVYNPSLVHTQRVLDFMRNTTDARSRGVEGLESLAWKIAAARSTTYSRSVLFFNV